MVIQDDLLDNEQTAALLGIKPNTLEIWRCKAKGPEFVKMGDTPQAPVRYRRSAIMDWLARQSFASTTEVPSSAYPRGDWLARQSFASTTAYSPAALTSAKPHNLRSTPASV